MNLEKVDNFTQQSEKDKQLQSLEKKNTSIYLIYYLSNLYANMILLSLYFVRVYQQFPSCIDERNGQNVTFSFEIAYWLGFVIQFAETVNVNIVGVYFRFKVERKEIDETNLDFTQLCSALSNYLYWFLTILMFGTTIFQSRILRKAYGSICLEADGDLYQEAMQLKWIIHFQFIKIAVISTLKVLMAG